jgi:hypothetical protein
MEILTRILQAAGGAQTLASVRDHQESGEITFYWAKDVKGAVLIRSLGWNYFRMDADLPQGRHVWVVRDGSGWKRESDEELHPISSQNAINLGNLAFPVAHVQAALLDPETEVSFEGIEKQGSRSVYRLRLRGRFGLVAKSVPAGIVLKDLLIDALTYDILSVQDRPYSIYKSGGKSSDVAPRAIDFDDFRIVNGVRVPFSISTKLQGQRTMMIRLNEVAFNIGLSYDTFRQ